MKTDARDMRPGAKYYWWGLRGVPLRLELGPRDLDAGKVMAVKRTGEKSQIELATVAEEVTRVLGEVTDAVRARAEEHTQSHLCTVDSMEALVAALNEGNVAVVHWCGQRGCGDVIEEKASSKHPRDGRAVGICHLHGRVLHRLREAGEGDAGRKDVLKPNKIPSNFCFYGNRSPELRVLRTVPDPLRGVNHRISGDWLKKISSEFFEFRRGSSEP